MTHTPELGTLAVVVPALNEESAIAEFIHEAQAHLLPVGGLTRLTLVVVDDGSTDSTADVVKDLAAQHRSDNFRIELVRFTRNFGKDAAVYAGVQRAVEVAAHVGVMDADLQHPMHVMARMAKIAISGEEHVVGVMTFPKQKPWYSALKKLLHTLREVASDGATEPQGVGDFRVFSRRIGLEFLKLHERARFTRGMFSYLGSPATFVHFEVEPRRGGNGTRWPLYKLISSAITALASQGTGLLARLVTWSAVLMVGSFIIAVVAAVFMLVSGNLSGPMVLLVVLVGLQAVHLLFSIFIASHATFTLRETQKRPAYIVRETLTDEN